jgi:hypothetical protein
MDAGPAGIPATAEESLSAYVFPPLDGAGTGFRTSIATGSTMSTPNEPDYDPELTEHILEETGKLLQDSRRLLDSIDDRLGEGSSS